MSANDQNKRGGIYLALGGNLPFEARSPQETQTCALQRLEQSGVEIMAVSSFWTSPSWPISSDPTYTNCIAMIDTMLDAKSLLSLLLETENTFGRIREGRWGPRTLDLDLIDYQGQVLSSSSLTLPHPRAHERAFVLCPLEEIRPDWVHPVSNLPISTLISRLDPSDLQETRKIPG